MNPQSNIDFRIIKFESESYFEELQLRDRVLRKPLGMSLFDENLDLEINDCHIGAFSNNCLVGVLILTKLSNSEMKMRQVAVDDGKRGLSIGSQLVAFSEDYCKKSNYSRIVLNARATALEFYKRLGYTIISDVFFEIGIPHYKLEKIL